GAALVLEVSIPDRDAVLDALPLADQPRAGHRPMRIIVPALPRPLGLRQFLAERLQVGDGLGRQAAIGQFLYPVRQPALDVAPVEHRRLPLEQVAPLLLQLA